MSLRSDKQTAAGQYVGVRSEKHKLQQENRMNYRKLSMIALLVGIWLLCLPVPASAGGDVNIQNFFSGPVLVTAGAPQPPPATPRPGGAPRAGRTSNNIHGLPPPRREPNTLFAGDR